MRSKRRLMPALIAVLALTLAACGTSDDSTKSTKKAGGEKITVTDVNGADVTLDGPAERVVTLEWSQTEDAIALGINPVGIADIKGFKEWNTAVKVSGKPIDVGTRNEPSQDSVAKANPDLIIGSEESIPADALEQMKKIAPVVLMKSADANAPIERAKENFETVAKLTGKTEQAKKIIGDFDKTVAEGKSKIAAAKPGPFIFAYAYGTGNQVTFKMHGTRSVPGAVAAELGLQNAFTAPGDDVWGMQDYDLEAMTTLPADTRVLYWASDEANPIKDILPSNPVWTNLPYVKDNKVTPFGKGVWMYGGPSSMKQLAEAYVKAFAGS